MSRMLPALLVLLVPLIAPADLGGAPPQAPPARSLGWLFDTETGAVRDTNGDGLADRVAARVIVPAEPSDEDVLVAVNLSARLGFETVAFTLPLATTDDRLADPAAVELPILVGRGNRHVAALVDRGVIDPTQLEEGQGLVAVVPSPLGGRDGVVVVGADDAGTLAAGNTLAASSPRLWGASGSRFDTAEAEIADYLGRHGVRAGQPAVTAFVVDSDRRGLLSITVAVPVEAGSADDATRALADLDSAHRRGLEPETLNFQNVAETIVELRTPTGTIDPVRVRRSGPNSRALSPPDDPERGGGARGGRGGRGGGTGRGRGAAAAEEPPAGRGQGGRGGGGGAQQAPGRDFDLRSAFSIDGWLGDAYPDLIADRVETSILIGDGAESLGAAHIAARLGLESTGVAVPLSQAAADVEDPSREPSPILVGRTNEHVQALTKIGRARLDDLAPGEGAIQIVPHAFGNVTATVVAGADAAGTEAAALYLARRAPYIWDNRRGALTLHHVATQVADAFDADTGVSQAALATLALDEIVESIDDAEVEGVDANLFLEEKNEALESYLGRRLAEALPEVPTTVTTRAITDAEPVFEETKEFPWEVDEFRERFETEVLPKVTPGSTVRIDARLSEAPEVRRGLADEVRAALVAAGADGPDVRIRSAYKQGFLWMAEEVVPALADRSVASVHVRIKEHVPDFDDEFRFYTVPTRWLHELYPIDEVLEREIGLPPSAFTMELVDDPPETYAVEARDRRGRVVYEATFSPTVAEREYLEPFPGWSRVEVTTGWLRASVGGETVVDSRIETDPERFWDYYQGEVLPKIQDHVMELTNNRPAASQQPFHRDLEFEVWMSEPDFRIGIDEEQVSALESLHEDLYFVTLDFYNALGRNTTRARLRAPGLILPIIHPERRGQAASARVLYAANAARGPRLEVTVREPDAERPRRITRDLEAIDVGDPQVMRAVVAADGVRELEIALTPADDAAAGRAADLLDTVGRLHAAGLYRDALSYEGVGRLAFALSLGDARFRRVLPGTGAGPASPVHAAAERPALPLVTWDHVISPDESEAIVAQLSAFPVVDAYRAGRSYRGREISVMELTLPTPSEQISVTKYTAYKPTIFITGRQHANEVSSTSHILRLAELIATDPDYTRLLERINVILHPVENPDGAAIAYELQKLTPTHMLHAGRYSALGQDVSSGGALLPESAVRNDVWRVWRPDIYLNPHGYPSHEWVQQFAGYVSPQFRAYWSSRGWYTQLSGARDPRYPQISEATDALRDAIAGALTADDEVRAMNLRHQDRYRRWAYGFAPFLFNQEIYEDTAIYYTDQETGEFRGSRRLSMAGSQSAARATMNQWPQVTFNRGMTEAPDETAQGAWLDLVSRMGFSFLMAHLNYLHDGQWERQLVEENAARDGVARTWIRVRPVLPGKER